MAVPPNPDPSPAHSSTHTNCRYMRCRVTAVHPARHSCASDQSSAPEQQDTGMNSGSKPELQQPGTPDGNPPAAALCTTMLPLLSLQWDQKGCKHLQGDNLLLISGSSTSLYTCFPASKCLCFWDRKYFMIFVQKQPIISKLKLQSLASISSVFFHWEV